MNKDNYFNDWIEWAESTNKLGNARVEPLICEFIKSAAGASFLCGKLKYGEWNGDNWEHISNSYRNMLTFVLLGNPLQYTYPALLGRSIKEFDYHGVETSLLKEALEIVPDNHWIEFCEKYIKDETREDAIAAVNLTGEKKIKWVYESLIELVHLQIPDATLSQAMRNYFIN